MKKEWVVGIRNQCQIEDVTFFFKQWGGQRKSEAGRELDGMIYDEVPSRAFVPVASQRVRLELIADVNNWRSTETRAHST